MRKIRLDPCGRRKLMKHLNKIQIHQLKKQLIEEKQSLEKKFELNNHFGLASSLPDSTGELSTYGFDGEDAWQIVEKWGNSDSPAMSEDAESFDYNQMVIESDENEGFVEAFESFITTDLYGKEVSFVRNRAYHKYMKDHEGDHGLELVTADEEASLD